MALINPPNAGTVTVALPDSYVTTNGTVISSITLNGREGAVLTKYAAPGGPVPDGTYTLTNGASGMVLDDPGVSMAAGTEMIQWPVNGGSNQAWKFVSKGGGYYTIQNGASGLYLTSTGSSGSTVQQQKAASSNSQLWSLKAVGSSYMIVNRASSLALDDPAASTQQGVKMIVWGQHGGTNQQWTIH
jgi:hypothetical protein